MKLRVPVIITAAIMVLAAAGCSSTAGPSAVRLDTPSRHVANGMTLLDSQKTDAALREFRRALELDATYSPAWVGLGLAYGQQGNPGKGLTHLQTAEKYARSQDQQRQVEAAYQRLRAMDRDRSKE
jgi:Tfp pilus assembly protein PilF